MRPELYLQSTRSTLVEPITVTPLLSELLPMTVAPSDVEAKCAWQCARTVRL